MTDKLTYFGYGHRTGCGSSYGTDFGYGGIFDYMYEKGYNYGCGAGINNGHKYAVLKFGVGVGRGMLLGCGSEDGYNYELQL